MCVFVCVCVCVRCRHGQVKCVELLLGRGSEVISDNDGLSTLEVCAQVSRMIEVLARQLCTYLPIGTNCPYWKETTYY